MKSILLLTITILLTSSFVSAQSNGSLKGKLVDTAASQGLADATISVINRKDSSLVTFTLSVKGGYFEIKSLDRGEYRLMASFRSYQTLKKDFDISADKPNIDLGELPMQKEFRTMDEVVITDDAPVKIKGDTIAFKADAFKTKPNATVEDLLKKIPGMQVDKDGTVKAQGENVQKVYVDGKEFFSNDPKLATKNLAADMVDQVEVFDDMSEQAKFNGIDDGSRSKSINLKLKKEKKKGIFGKIYGGYGTDERYDAGVNANFFKGASQVSLIAKANNTNNIGFTVSDMLGMMGGGGFGAGNIGTMKIISLGGGGSFGGLNLGSGGTGITSSWQAGLNYRDTWSKKFDVNGSYFFNHAETNNLRKSFRQTSSGDSTIDRTQHLRTMTGNDNHRMNFNVIFQIDSFNSIIYSPNINFQQSANFSDDTTSSYAVRNGSQYKLNDSRALNESEGSGMNWTNNLIYRKRFRTKGRTFSLNLSNTYNLSDREGLNTSVNNFYNVAGLKIRDLIFRQQTLSENTTNNYGVSASYTEPLAKNKVLEFNYGYNKNQYESDRRTMDYNTGTGKYDILNDSLSNIFHNLNETNRLGTNFRVVNKKYNYQFGLAVQRTLLSSDNISKDTLVTQKFTNLFPNASFNYQFARSRNLRINYRGRTNQPSISQLQPVPDVSNPLNTRLGNPNLQQEFTNNININYSYFDMIKFRTLFAFISLGNTYNKIGNSITQLPGGAQVTQPVNLSGVFNVNGNFTLGFPIKKMKGGNFNTNTRVAFNRDATLIDGDKNYTKNFIISEDLRLNYNYKEKLDVGIGVNVSYTSASYTIQKTLNTDYFTHTYSGDINYRLPMNFSISTDFDYTFNTGRADGYNQNYAMWNAGIAKQVFKNKKGEIKLSVFDILNQNISITRTTELNYVEDVENTVLQRFFMLTFTYNLNRMGGKSLPAFLERGMKDIRIMH